jgi:hypothetical protein
MRLAFAVAALAVGALCQDTSVPVSMVVTVEPHHGTQAPKLTRDDVMVFQDKDNRRPVIGWTPVQDVGLQLWVLIDDGADDTIGNQFGDLRKFILAQPPAVEIGLGYMRNGGVTAVQSLSTDHQSVAKALRLPLGEAGISASPYLSLVDLIHTWPATQRAREAVMVTSGIDYLYGPGPDNPYLQQAIDEAQRAGVVVSSIYFGSPGHAGHSYWQINWGQNNLSQLADATGGEFYWQGMTNPVSIGPYLDECGRRINEQFVLTFAAAPQSKAGLHTVHLRTEVPHVSLVAQKGVEIPDVR